MCKLDFKIQIILGIYLVFNSVLLFGGFVTQDHLTVYEVHCLNGSCILIALPVAQENLE